MNYENVLLRVPYTQYFVRPGRRRSELVRFWSELPVQIRKIEPEQASPAYRIVKTDESSPEPYLVRSFGTSLWWPVIDADGFVSPSRFKTLAAAGDPRVLIETLGVPWEHPREHSEQEFYGANPYKRIVSCTRDQQWAHAQRGASERVLFCGDNVLLEAGEPIYFIVPPWPRMRYKILAGSSSLDRDPDLGRGMIGAGRATREDSARHGLAFGIDEIHEELSRLGDRATDGYATIVERLIDRPGSDAAVVCCARAFIDLLWGNAQLDHRLHDIIPSLAKAGGIIEAIRRMSPREVLEDVISIEGETTRRNFSSDISRATNILRRLNTLCPLPLAEEDDVALSRLAPLQNA
jgi:hypothetical protein